MGMPAGEAAAAGHGQQVQQRWTANRRHVLQRHTAHGTRHNKSHPPGSPDALVHVCIGQLLVAVPLLWKGEAGRQIARQFMRSPQMACTTES